MGNAIMGTCCRPEHSPTLTSAVNLISYGGGTMTLTGNHLAGEIMFEFPDRMVCHADSFFIGRPIPSLAIDDELVPGQTYFLLPLDNASAAVLSASSLAALCSGPNKNRAGFKGCPFEYTKGSDGRVLIKVVPEFIARLISDEEMMNNGGGNSPLCSTPELRKHYNQLVGTKDRIWSPKLETISERRIRFSPCAFMGLERKKQEIDG